MKAYLRCKAHFQGDRCRLKSGHDEDHDSNFARWNDKITYRKVNLGHRRDRIGKQREKAQTRIIDSIKKQIRFIALLEEYSRSFKNKPEE